MDDFMKIINGNISSSMPTEEDFELLEDTEGFDEDAFEDGFFEFAHLGDMEFSVEYADISQVNSERFLEALDVPHEIKLEAEFVRAVRKLFKAVVPDFDYESYEGGKSESDSRKIDIGGNDFKVELEAKREGDDKSFELTVRLIKL
jgi:hypothetical protein